MSKLYNKYLQLKDENPSSYYLFKSGIFYIFLAEDAVKMSKFLNLKLTNLNETVVKCGFPVKNSEKYLNLLKLNNYDVEIVESIDSQASPKEQIFYANAKNFIKDLSNIDYTNISVSEAFSLLEKISLQAKNYLNTIWKE